MKLYIATQHATQHIHLHTLPPLHIDYVIAIIQLMLGILNHSIAMITYLHKTAVVCVFIGGMAIEVYDATLVYEPLLSGITYTQKGRSI